MKAYQLAVLRPSWLRLVRLFTVLLALAVLLVASISAAGTPRAEALDSEEQAFLGIINQYRASNGLGALKLDPKLNEVARWMADDMAANNYFSHTDSLGRDPFVRMDQIGYNYNTWRGENLVAGTDTADYAFKMWSESPGHNSNMLSGNYTVIGIARAYDSSSVFGWYWATEFGGHSTVAAPPPAAPVTPKPVPQAPPPAQPAPPPAPVHTAKPVVTAPPPSPTPTPEPERIVIAEKDDDARWWQSMLRVGDVPVDEEDDGPPNVGSGIGSLGVGP